MTKQIYTIQNEFGEEGFIQRIHEMRVYDDVNEYSTELNYECLHQYHVIHKHEYELMLSLTQTITDQSVRGDSIVLKDCETLIVSLTDYLIQNSTPLIEYLFSKLK